jgi:hypothetical protein
MLIKLTEISGKTFYFDANNVRGVKQETKVKMKSKLEVARNDPQPEETETHIITYLMTPQGLQSIVVQESDEEVARMVNAARSGKNLLVD